MVRAVVVHVELGSGVAPHGAEGLPGDTQDDEGDDQAEQRGYVYATKRGYGIRWRDAAGAQHRRAGFETKRDARKWLHDHIDAGIRADRLTFAELVDAYLAAHAVGCEASTITTLRERLKRAVDVFGELDLRDLERRAVEIAAWQATLPAGSRFARKGIAAAGSAQRRRNPAPCAPSDGRVRSAPLSSVSLFFIGAVLVVNGLVLHGRIEPKGAAPVNAFVGAVLVAAAGRLALPAGADEAALVSATGFLLFGVTYLWVALNAWTGHPAGGLGWYCAWATGVSVFLGLVTLIHEDDTKFALLWLLWALLFATFFIVMALGRSTLNHAAGWLAIMEAIATASVPGGLLMIGQWDDLATAWMAIAAAAVIGVFLVLAHRPRPAA